MVDFGDERLELIKSSLEWKIYELKGDFKNRSLMNGRREGFVWFLKVK